MLLVEEIAVVLNDRRVDVRQVVLAGRNAAEDDGWAHVERRHGDGLHHKVDWVVPGEGLARVAVPLRGEPEELPVGWLDFLE